MSSHLINQLKRYPYLMKYAKNGLINLNALARLIGDDRSTSAVGMELRRLITKFPEAVIKPFDFSQYKLQLVTRTNVHEIILTKNQNNRGLCLDLVHELSKAKYFVTLVEGEKEIVVMTDYPIKDLVSRRAVKKVLNNITEDLGYVSIDFPIEMRKIPGIYSLVTYALASENIPIHSFHTIGGEILILVKNEDLVRTQEVLHFLLFSAEKFDSICL